MSPTLGIDIGGSSVKCARLQADRVVATAHAPYSGSPSPETIALAIRAAVRQCSAAQPEAGSIGLCAPGIVDPQSLRVTASLNLPALVGTRLPDLIERALGAASERPRVCVFTDARAAAHDYWCLMDRPSARLLAVSLGTGVGAAVLDAGAPLIVSGGGPGHLGSLDVRIDDHPPRARDGAIGTLEAYIGLPALRARYGDSLAEAASQWTVDEPPIRALARALRVAHAIYRPSHLALLGGVGVLIGRAPGLVEALRSLVADGLTSLAREGWTLTATDSPFHAAAGAARLVAMSE